MSSLRYSTSDIHTNLELLLFHNMNMECDFMQPVFIGIHGTDVSLTNEEY